MTRATMPGGGLYSTPRGLYPFQADGIAEGYLRLETTGTRDGVLVVWDTGTGKSHFAMAISALLIEDDEIDAVLLVAEKNKISEWVEDFAKSTTLSARVHHGTGRDKRLAKAGVPDVLVTTYETAKTDFTKVIREPGKRGMSVIEGPLFSLYAGKKMLVIYDEMTKLKNRTSQVYKGHEFLLKRLAKQAHLRVVGLTATPVEKDYEDTFNLGRLVRPDLMPTVTDFEKRFVRSRHPMYGTPVYRDEVMHEFAQILRPLVLRKRKTDPDVIDQFPKQVEESKHLVLDEREYALYEALEELGQEHLALTEQPLPGLWSVLRLVAGYPEALLAAKGGLAQQIVSAFGADYLTGLPATKAAWLRDYLDLVVTGQGAKAVVFTFFGQSILPLLARDLRDAGIKVFINHGAMATGAQTESRVGFRSWPGPAVFLTSDAGARGLNLPEALYVCEFESSLTFANRTQRLNRVHRIDSTHPSVTALTMFADHTVEDLIAHNMIGRNAQHDVLLDDDADGEDFISSADRRSMLQIARGRKARRKS